MLTQREIEVLGLSKRGLTQVQIASRLGISQPAVSDFYNNALHKIKDSEDVIRAAKKLRVISKALGHGPNEKVKNAYKKRD